jgi:hypothetical protein
MKTTRQELALKGISKLTEETELSTVYFLDNGWLVCVNDDGKEVTVKPDNLRQWDDRKEIDLNAGGCFYTLFFTRDSGSECSLDLKHTHPMAFQAGLKLPQQVLQWALERAR